MRLYYMFFFAFVVIINHTKTANCKDNNQTAQAPVEIEKLMELRTKNITKLLEKKTSLHRLKKNKTSNQHETQQTEKILLQEINTLKNEIIKIKNHIKQNIHDPVTSLTTFGDNVSYAAVLRKYNLAQRMFQEYAHSKK